MPGRRRVAHQHDVLVVPPRANHARKLHPHRRPAQMRGVGHQVMPAQMGCKDLTAGFDRLFLGHRQETPGLPCLGQAFDDEGRGIGVELIDMRPDPAMRRLLEDKRKGIVELGMGAQPDELAAPRVDVGLEHGFVFPPHGRVDAVAGDHQIVRGAVFLGRAELGLEPQVHAQFTRPRLQQDQHRLATDAREPVPARYIAHPVVHHGDIVPIGKVLADRLCQDRVVRRHPFQRIVRQNHTPAEGVVGAVALHHRHLMVRVAQLHRDGEVQTRRSTPKAEYLHRPDPFPKHDLLRLI